MYCDAEWQRRTRSRLAVGELCALHCAQPSGIYKLHCMYTEHAQSFDLCTHRTTHNIDATDSALVKHLLMQAGARARGDTLTCVCVRLPPSPPLRRRICSAVGNRITHTWACVCSRSLGATPPLSSSRPFLYLYYDDGGGGGTAFLYWCRRRRRRLDMQASMW